MAKGFCTPPPISNNISTSTDYSIIYSDSFAQGVGMHSCIIPKPLGYTVVPTEIYWKEKTSTTWGTTNIVTNAAKDNSNPCYAKIQPSYSVITQASDYRSVDIKIIYHYSLI